MLVCKNCKKTPLRVNNRSGWCTACRKAHGNRVPASGEEQPRARDRRSPSAVNVAVELEALPLVFDLPDDYLVACVGEARERRRRIQEEAAARAEKLAQALQE